MDVPPSRPRDAKKGRHELVCCAHVSKASAEKRLQRKQLLTLNDGEDSRHWGGKADIGWCVWRGIDGPTLLHIDKLKDHETMGRPTLCELELDRALNQFRVSRIGYDKVKPTGAD